MEDLRKQLEHLKRKQKEAKLVKKIQADNRDRKWKKNLQLVLQSRYKDPITKVGPSLGIGQLTNLSFRSSHCQIENILRDGIPANIQQATLREPDDKWFDGYLHLKQVEIDLAGRYLEGKTPTLHQSDNRSPPLTLGRNLRHSSPAFVTIIRARPA